MGIHAGNAVARGGGESTAFIQDGLRPLQEPFLRELGLRVAPV